MTSIWIKLRKLLPSSIEGVLGIGNVFGRMMRFHDRRVGFTIAVIALGAKLAKVDGTVTHEEVRAFRTLFRVPDSEQRNVARVFNYASRTSIGYEHYARSIRRASEPGSRMLEHVVEGLFYIATADGILSLAERRFLTRVSTIFGLSRTSLRARLRFYSEHVTGNPYQVLGVSEEATLDDIKRVWRKRVKSCHPDVLIADGVPEEAIRITGARLIQYNQAWETIKAIHRQPQPAAGIQA